MRAYLALRSRWIRRNRMFVARTAAMKSRIIARSVIQRGPGSLDILERALLDAVEIDELRRMYAGLTPDFDQLLRFKEGSRIRKRTPP